jgi:hypothetical protein
LAVFAILCCLCFTVLSGFSHQIESQRQSSFQEERRFLEGSSSFQFASHKVITVGFCYQAFLKEIKKSEALETLSDNDDDGDEDEEAEDEVEPLVANLKDLSVTSKSSS